MTRYRLTIRGTGIELRGWVDEAQRLGDLSVALAAIGPDEQDPMIVASTVPDDWTPFGPSAPTRTVTLPGDDPDASSRVVLQGEPLLGLGDWYPTVDRGAGGWGTRGQEGDG